MDSTNKLVALHKSGASSLSQLPQNVTRLDLNALHNLIDPSEEEYLRERLPIADFKRIMEERMQALLAYVEEKRP